VSVEHGVNDPRRGPRRTSLRRLSLIVAIAVVIGVVGVLAYIASEGSRVLVYGDDVPHGCATPAVMGWSYEAINYDVALDARLPVDNADWLNACPNHGADSAGTEVVSSDGIRVAGWYIQSGDKDPPTAPTVVIVHGWGVSKSDTLRYAATMHDQYNLTLIDLRHAGRSSGQQMTFGVRESLDLTAMLDWLVRTKNPSSIAVFGDSGGAAAAAKLARTDERIAALILESAHARATNPIEQRVGRGAAERLGPAAPPAPVSAWVVEFGIWIRTGAWPGDADPIDAIPDLGKRPLAIIYGTADDSDLPDRNARVLFAAAEAAGVPVEIHACPGATHGKVVEACPAEYRMWVDSFLEPAFGS
jgi:pimeloyl-ACP methyl ester carboxylesterase